jgi:2-polyprenyl-3-methyl-5-hydroxy-6-metoxy-1,4-benzoquinol methylase
MLRIFHKRLSQYKPKNILDVGCNDGSRTIFVAEHFRINAKNVYGIDYDDELITLCRERFNTEKVDLEVDNIPHENDFFDLVICNQVLEHLKSYRKVIDDLVRVTKEGGYIIIGIPNLAHLINRIYLLFGFQPMCIHLDGPHVRAFTHRSFLKILVNFKGIELIDCTGAVMYPLPFSMTKFISDYFIGLSGYVCYLLRKEFE